MIIKNLHLIYQESIYKNFDFSNINKIQNKSHFLKIFQIFEISKEKSLFKGEEKTNSY